MDKVMSTDSNTDGDRMLYKLATFFRQYVNAPYEHLWTLALWTLHTHCFTAARTTPYLNICSHERQAGKTRCLEVLNLVAADTWLATGITPSMLVKKILHSRPTVLLDECQTAFGGSDRQVRGILVSGSRVDGCYEAKGGTQTVEVFCPKAFAGMRILPSAIAERSINILLSPNKSDNETRRFVPKIALKDAEAVVADIRKWVDRNLLDLINAKPYTYGAFPEKLTRREQDMLEPLLHLIDAIGGNLAPDIQKCLLKCVRQDSAHAYFVQLLADVRDAFSKSEKPDRIPTTALLDYLNSLQSRPWNKWDNGAPMNAKDLAQMLDPHSIKPGSIRLSPSFTLKSYTAKDFAPLWTHHLTSEQATCK
jgi:uncharacterized protein DUF3631